MVHSGNFQINHLCGYYYKRRKVEGEEKFPSVRSMKTVDKSKSLMSKSGCDRFNEKSCFPFSMKITAKVGCAAFNS